MSRADSGAGPAPSGGSWALPIRIDLSGVEPAEKAGLVRGVLRSRPGSAVFVRAGRGVFVGATGDLREFVARRLGDDGPGVNLGAVADGVLACETGSGFEADIACEALSARWTPVLHRQAADQRRCVFLSLDPDAEVPVWRLIEPADLADGTRPGSLIGPFGHRSAAETFGRVLDDRFELCREPSLLAQRPGARACVYKEMGRCPAPCDGSEPMDVYRDRVRRALGFVRQGPGSARGEVEREIASASASLDFERAAAGKSELDMLDSLSGPAFAWATTLDCFGVLAVLPSGRRGWARLMRHRAGETRHLFDLDARRAESALDGVWESLVAGSPPGGFGLTRESIDAVSLVCAHIFSGRRARSAFIRLDRSPAPADVVRAVRRAANVEAESPEEPTETT